MEASSVHADNEEDESERLISPNFKRANLQRMLSDEEIEYE
jgi:hypothetical protein